ncbi:MAG: hypothetical protein KDD69_06985 [Bdellovibrionales bacterium]|nr:hypothetical protein [Bdellovibrionales bacterium]
MSTVTTGTPRLSPMRLEILLDRVLREMTFTDIHVHDMPDVMGPEFALAGPDATIDYHYLYGEVLSDHRFSDAEAEALWQLPQAERVDLLIERSFGDGALPVSEGRLGILTAAHALGLPTDSGDIKRIVAEWRTLYAELGRERYTNLIFEKARVNRVISTQSPFVEAECERYLDDRVIAEWDPRYWCGLRFDEFAHKPETIGPLCERMKFPGAAGPLGNPKAQLHARKLLEFWIDRLPNVRYVALSLPGKLDFSDSQHRALLTIEQVLAPVCRERNLPLFLMPFVRRQINPAYRNAGDVVERGDINGLIDLISRHRDILWAVTPLDEGDNYPLSFATRALGNLRVWGHWWCNLNPSLIKQQLKLRLENNGYAHYGINSDARIRDQLLFKFPHYLRVLHEVLLERCLDIQQLSGWPVTEEQVTATVERLHDYRSLLRITD